MQDCFNERDWRLFRAKLPGWQEDYMDQCNRAYIALLQADRNPSEKFWELHNRIQEDKRSAGVQVDMRRSKFLINVVALINDGVITLNDIAEFSSGFQEAVRAFIHP